MILYDNAEIVHSNAGLFHWTCIAACFLNDSMLQVEQAAGVWSIASFNEKGIPDEKTPPRTCPDTGQFALCYGGG
jgi:hypothetical protein